MSLGRCHEKASRTGVTGILLEETMEDLHAICEKLNAEYPIYQHHHNRTWRKASKSEPWEEVEIDEIESRIDRNTKEDKRASV
jgi:hypothetical protein